MAVQAFEPTRFPKAHARMVALAGAEVDAVDVVLSGHIQPARQEPGAAAFALRARQKVHVDMSGERIGKPDWRAAWMVDEMGAALICIPCLLVATWIGVERAQMRPPFLFQTFFVGRRVERAGDVAADALFILGNKDGIGPQMQIRNRIDVTDHAPVGVKRRRVLPRVARRKTYGIQRVFILSAGGTEGQHWQPPSRVVDKPARAL
ncbi:hypothetical protein AT6N2_C1002 [Agrobacterium tumefaciens]|nr:hypothetical protein AT6N2_C1002 [Agrobacterium tumefaciens]